MMSNNRDVPHPGNKIKIPVPEDQILRALLKVKPTKDMPRPGTSRPPGTKPKQHWVKKGNVAACGAVVSSSSKNSKKERSKITCQSCLAILAREDLRKDQEAVRKP